MARRPRKAEPPPPSFSFSWRDHPIVVAVGTAAATTVFLMAIYSSLVIPTQTAKLEIELLESVIRIESQKRTLERATRSLNKATESLTNLQNRNSGLHSVIANLHKKALYQATTNLFTPGNPYPNGLGKARIGMSKDQVILANESLSMAPDQDSPDMLTFNVKNSPFERVTYYLDDKSGKVTHISFEMGFMHNYGDSYLQDKIIENFGAPIESPRKRYFRWVIGDKIWHILMIRNGNYVLLPYPQVLAVWPSEIS